MAFGLIVGVLTGLLIFISGWLKVILIILTRGILGNNLPWLYLFLGFYIGAGIIAKMTSFEYWITFISTMVSAFLANQIAANYEIKHNGSYGTVSTSGSMTMLGGLLGMLYHFLF